MIRAQERMLTHPDHAQVVPDPDYAFGAALRVAHEVLASRPRLTGVLNGFRFKRSCSRSAIGMGLKREGLLCRGLAAIRVHFAGITPP